MSSAVRCIAARKEQNVMPSPFPGMDPFLEGPDLFPDLHFSFIVLLSEALNAVLPAPYYSAIAHRSWMEPADCVEPDVIAGAEREVPDSGATQPVVVHVDSEEVVERYLELHAHPR